MNERRKDFELLRDFVRGGDESAFSTLVHRHLDLVFATAVRKVDDLGAAQEVTQNVFVVLARKAWTFAPDDSLPSWLYRTTLLEAKHWWRGELRRRRREQTAAELGTTMKTSEEQPALRALTPLLDEALLSLREKERSAILLRFYENQPWREVGSALGVSEDAAQKRVGASLEKLVGFFQRRGFKTATTLSMAAALQHTAVSAPATAAGSVLNAAMQAGFPTMGGVSAWLARLASLSKIQTSAACLLLVAIPMAWQGYEHWVSRKEGTAVQAQLDTGRAEVQEASRELDPLQKESARLDAALLADNAPAQYEEAARKLAGWKAQAQALLTNSTGYWTQDFPYVRIPKATIKDLGLHAMFNSGSGALSAEASEVLGMTLQEKLQTEGVLADYLHGIDNLSTSQAYETNLPSTQPSRLTKTVVIPPLGQELKSLANGAGAQISLVLGPEREKLLFGGWDDGAIQFFWPGNLWNIAEDSQTLTVWVDPSVLTEHGPLIGASRASKMGGTSSEGRGSLGVVPGGITSRFFAPWLRQQGIQGF
jgi:RNA polymerase sigma factor (sigma-70 family)